jgi:uncharacterized membrane protein YjgN (DUF898 family)
MGTSDLRVHADVAAAVAASERRYPVEFTGSAGEYFRIWIVNLVLTILTLGIYSAWAKVRKRRYFYAHTRVDGDSFEYRGSPIAVLKGRLIAFGVLLIFYAAGHFTPYAPIGFAVVAAFAVPWLIVRSTAFNAYNTAYRNIRLHFRGTYPKCLGLVLGYGLLMLVTAGIGYFYLRVRLTEFIARNHYYGTTQFQTKVPDLKPLFFNIYSKAIGLGILFALFAVGVPALLGAAGFGTGGARNALATQVAVTLAIYAVYLLIFAFVRARITNATLNNIVIGPVSLESALRARDVAWLYVGNIVAIVVTLGLAVPWAVVRSLRYRASKTTVIAAGGLETFVAAESAQVSAAGAEIGEMFDFDLGL